MDGSIHLVNFVSSFQVDGGTNISVKLKWSQKLLYHEGQVTLNIPFSFPDYVTPAARKISKREKIELNVNAGPETEILCKTTSHPLKVPLYSGCYRLKKKDIIVFLLNIFFLFIGASTTSRKVGFLI